MSFFRLFGVLVMCLMLQGDVMAGARTDFSGVWVLDLEQSESIDAILKAQGRSWAERKLADSITVTQTIEQSDTLMKLHIESVATDRNERLKLDGTSEKIQSERAGEMVTRSVWNDEGTVLTTINDFKLQDGTPVSMRFVRTLVDEKTLRQDIELHLAEGKVLKAKRILRKNP